MTGETHEDELSSTTVSDPSVFVKFLVCCSSSLPVSKFYLQDRPLKPVESPPPPFIFPAHFLDDAFRIRRARNSRMLRHVTNLCRTPRLSLDVLRHCIPSKYTNIRELTCGGMSRIYSAEASTGEKVVIKTTDCSRGLGLHEYECYHMLETKGFPIPTIHYVAMYKSFSIMIMSRHSLSLSSILLTLAERHTARDIPLLDSVLHNVRYLLHQLSEKDVSYCDFSPDNIMVDIDPVTRQGRCILIDPQFALPTHRLSKKMGRHWAENIDRVHFAYKIKALAMQTRQLASISKHVCEEFLGNDPSERQARHWILNVLPHGLRVAYDLIHASSSKKNSLETVWEPNARQKKILPPTTTILPR